MAGKKKGMIGVVVAVVLSAVGAGGYFYVSSLADQTAEQEARRALIEGGLDRSIGFEKASASLFGDKAVLRSVRISDPATGTEVATAREITLEEFEREGDKLISVSVGISGLHSDLIALARKVRQKEISVPLAIGHGPAYSTLLETAALGYHQLTADARIEYRFDPEWQRSRLAVSFDVEDAAQGQAVVALDRIDEEAIGRMLSLSDVAQERGKKGAWAVVEAFLEEAPSLLDAAKKLHLADLQVRLTDQGFLERAYGLEAERSAFTKGGDEFRKIRAAAIREGLASSLLELHVSPEEAEGISAAAYTFLSSGGNLTLSTKIARPMRVFEPADNIFRIGPGPAFTGLDRFIKLAKVTVEN